MKRITVTVDDDVDEAICLFMAKLLEYRKMKSPKYTRALNILIRAALHIISNMRVVDIMSTPSIPERLNRETIEDAIMKLLDVL